MCWYLAGKREEPCKRRSEYGRLSVQMWSKGKDQIALTFSRLSQDRCNLLVPVPLIDKKREMEVVGEKSTIRVGKRYQSGNPALCLDGVIVSLAQFKHFPPDCIIRTHCTCCEMENVSLIKLLALTSCVANTTGIVCFLWSQPPCRIPWCFNDRNNLAFCFLPGPSRTKNVAKKKASAFHLFLCSANTKLMHLNGVIL